MFRHEFDPEHSTKARRAVVGFVSSLALGGALSGCGEQSDGPVVPEPEVVCDYEKGGNHIVKDGESLDRIALEHVEANDIDIHYKYVSESIGEENNVGVALVIGKELTLPSDCEIEFATPQN